MYPQAYHEEDEVQSLVNSGYSGKLYLESVECPCGKTRFLESRGESNIIGTPIVEKENTSAQCSACGTWTCSKKCHDKYLTKENKCTFHHNFIPEQQNKVN